MNSDQLYTYWKPLESFEINNEFLFNTDVKENTIYSHVSSNYSEEILLGTLKKQEKYTTF